MSTTVAALYQRRIFEISGDVGDVGRAFTL